mmetsp:Transcript_3873/g.9235  ORF Transcript_3873/g.9235 Transcript_3873/m.9235 type:complete len:528 (+) Transcript_3873:177-1760(+)
MNTKSELQTGTYSEKENLCSLPENDCILAQEGGEQAAQSRPQGAGYWWKPQTVTASVLIDSHWTGVEATPHPVKDLAEKHFDKLARFRSMAPRGTDSDEIAEAVGGSEAEADPIRGRDAHPAAATPTAWPAAPAPAASTTPRIQACRTVAAHPCGMSVLYDASPQMASVELLQPSGAAVSGSASQIEVPNPARRDEGAEIPDGTGGTMCDRPGSELSQALEENKRLGAALAELQQQLRAADERVRSSEETAIELSSQLNRCRSELEAQSTVGQDLQVRVDDLKAQLEKAEARRRPSPPPDSPSVMSGEVAADRASLSTDTQSCSSSHLQALSPFASSQLSPADVGSLFSTISRLRSALKREERENAELADFVNYEKECIIQTVESELRQALEKERRNVRHARKQLEEERRNMAMSKQVALSKEVEKRYELEALLRDSEQKRRVLETTLCSNGAEALDRALQNLRQSEAELASVTAVNQEMLSDLIQAHDALQPSGGEARDKREFSLLLEKLSSWRSRHEAVGRLGTS